MKPLWDHRVEVFNIRGMRRCDDAINYHEMIGHNNEGMTGEASIIICFRLYPTLVGIKLMEL
jgi:hypothetical protein